MNVRKLLWFLLILLLIPFAFEVKGQDFGKGVSLFTDIKANQVGDVLTVLIYEQRSATQRVNTKTEKTTKGSTQGGPGIGTLSFLPLFGFDADAKLTHDGKGENTRNGSLRAKMTVTVVGVKPNGDLIIEGSRTVGVSNDKEVLTLSGVVRQKDVTTANTIDSYLIADAQISYTGKGAAETGARPGLMTRLINWLF